MKVHEVMTPAPRTILLTESLRQAIELMATVHCRRLPVVNQDGTLAGIITDRDVRLAMNSPLIMRERWQDDLLLDHTEVNACMSEDPITIGPTAPLQDAIRLMNEKKISGLPVVDSGELVGIITVTDLLRALEKLLVIP